MGNPLSKCCAEDTTLPRNKNKAGANSADASNASLVDSTARADADEPVAAYVPGKNDNAVDYPNDSTNKSAPGFFQRVSQQFSSLSSAIVGPRTKSIEEGLEEFPYPLSEEERQVLIKNAIPASEIKKLSIGVDAGGMGIIHVAEWKGQKVAIKEASIRVISKEVEIYSRMKGSEGVVEFYGVTFPPGLDKMCIVTKYADKGSLTWHLKVEYQTLTWADKLRLGTQISTGISRLHTQGIYHRDLHGGNILIDDKGNAMLTDFGASTIMEERIDRNRKEYALEEVPAVQGQSKFISKQITGLNSVKNNVDTDTGNDDPLIGVMAYIAPERFRNPKHFDAKCDIYSLGVLLWELTAGHSAFSRVPQDVHLAVAIMNGKREIAVDGTPAEYKALYEKCWQTDPALRPSMEEILETLAKVRVSMSAEQLAATRTRNLSRFESVDVYEQSLSIPRPTSDIQQHFLSE
ncbi:hypothetical protein BGZ99_003203 [Dissophora globulifera]|uniref:Protein kinase domain-containing protein n=1 Tax=Dissophora globulifera TaxID=979702 RepID=A0A9P6RNT8_9FUNG|nr:hypothetical protein BGZ99_003203 [Dissophora globulifera]